MGCQLYAPCAQVPSDMPSILLVEDTQIVRDIIAHRLRQAGCAVRCASSGEEALPLMKAQRFDVVFCDQQMPPGMDGLATVRRLRHGFLLRRGRPLSICV